MSNDTTYIAGVGITRFDKQPAKSVKDLVRDAVTQALADAGINIDLISTSEVRLNVVVAAEHGQKSLEVLRKRAVAVTLQTMTESAVDIIENLATLQRCFVGGNWVYWELISKDSLTLYRDCVSRWA